MDRNRIESIAQTPQDRMLLAKVWDKINSGIRKNVPAYTMFLTAREQALCQSLTGKAEGLFYFGGYADAERRLLAYLPDYLDESALTDDDGPLICIRCEFYKDEKPDHRDILGALMGMGIARETVGDICIGTDQCEIFVLSQIAPYILQNFTSAGRYHLKLTQIPLTQVQISAPELKEIHDTIASLRLDSIISSGFRISRSLASQYITQGKASIDALPCEKPDKAVQEGSAISVRGLGKIRLSAIRGRSKKDRIRVVIHRYM